MRKHYRFILAAPAVAGLLFYGAACDMEDDTAQTTPRETTPGEATPQTTPPAAGDRAEPAGGMQTPTGAAVSEAQVEQVTQAIEQARQTNEGLSARIEANTEIEAWGTGEQAKQRQTRVSELLDTVEAAVRQQDWDRTATNVRTLLTQPMPAELKQQMGMIVQRLKGLNVPQLQGLEFPEELPTVPGVPAPGEGGGVPPAGGNRPGGQ